jgi:hypothetical protein
MIELQLGRRNLNDAWRYKLAMTHKEILLEIGKKNQSLAGGDKKSLLSIVDKAKTNQLTPKPNSVNLPRLLKYQKSTTKITQ